jgi:hypothetical protein
MTTWQADFYHRPQPDASGQTIWELLICDETRSFEYEATCPQSQANSLWLTSQLQQISKDNYPDVIKVFRPQSLSLIETAASRLGILCEANRRTTALKEWLRQKQYPLIVDKPPPIPLSENLWGEQWRFANIAADYLISAFSDLPIPILDIPEYLKPLNLGLASTTPIPGVVIYGGRKSMRLARWLKENSAVSLSYIAGAPDGLILEAGLVDRWIVATFEDDEVARAGKIYEERKQNSKGLHFLLVQPDDSGMTHSGFWLLQTES